jgi:hypothetical protein
MASIDNASDVRESWYSGATQPGEVGGKHERGNEMDESHAVLAVLNSQARPAALYRVPFGAESGPGAATTQSIDHSGSPPGVIAVSASQLPEIGGYDAQHSLIARQRGGRTAIQNGASCIRKAGDQVAVTGEGAQKDRCAVSIVHDGNVYHHYFIFSDSGAVKPITPFQRTRQDKVVWQTRGDSFESMAAFFAQVRLSPVGNPKDSPKIDVTQKVASTDADARTRANHPVSTSITSPIAGRGGRAEGGGGMSALEAWFDTGNVRHDDGLEARIRIQEIKAERPDRTKPKDRLKGLPIKIGVTPPLG